MSFTSHHLQLQVKADVLSTVHAAPNAETSSTFGDRHGLGSEPDAGRAAVRPWVPVIWDELGGSCVCGAGPAPSGRAASPERTVRAVALGTAQRGAQHGRPGPVTSGQQGHVGRVPAPLDRHIPASLLLFEKPWKPVSPLFSR